MKHFSLEKWLKDKSRKVIDDHGFPVEIIKWDTNEKYPVVYLNRYGFAYNVSADGMYDADPNHGLFFADEEEKKHELTEFEKTMIQFSHERNSLIQFEHTTEEINAHLYLYSEKLLDLARKEVLKDFPKWKKDNNNLSSTFYRLDNRGGGDILLCRKGYAISIKELLNLPKEE